MNSSRTVQQHQYATTAVTARNKKRATSSRAPVSSQMQFPGKLHNMMDYVEQEGLQDVISWVQDGTALKVHQPKKLVEILPLYFSQTKFRSFERQLNMWHFDRIQQGPNRGAFIHPYFVRGRKALCSKMSRHLKDNQWKNGNSMPQSSKCLPPLTSLSFVKEEILPVNTIDTSTMTKFQSESSWSSIESALNEAQAVFDGPPSLNKNDDFLVSCDIDRRSFTSQVSTSTAGSVDTQDLYSLQIPSVTSLSMLNPDPISFNNKFSSSYTIEAALSAAQCIFDDEQNDDDFDLSLLEPLPMASPDIQGRDATALLQLLR